MIDAKTNSGILAAKGYLAAADTCGIKNGKLEREDISLLFSKKAANRAVIFTKNRVKAAPLLFNKESLRRGTKIRAIFTNSGNANACVGESGMRDCLELSKKLAELLRIKEHEILLNSTGIIGVPLPMHRILPNLPRLCQKLSEDQEAAKSAARAILTSDTRPKEATRRLDIFPNPIFMGAMAKGAGMIHPNMATMLAYVLCDAKISSGDLHKALRIAANQSFNKISVDGDQSTNDTVMILANGASNTPRIKSPSSQFDNFVACLGELCRELAIRIVADGERVSKTILLKVSGAATVKDAERVARAVANSVLCKCSWAGNDPNWGRVLHAAGYAGAKFDQTKVSVAYADCDDNLRINGEPKYACKNGRAHKLSTEKDTKGLHAEICKLVAKDRFAILLDLGAGEGACEFFTSDLTREYVEFNLSEYSLAKSRE